ncbi:MAG: leucyl aminopeptidase family protein [Candidatus Pacebacteria bacterium]|nr:leucyl aminopeptidase family protein [Candidatus Paceibacterota bacterium]
MSTPQLPIMTDAGTGTALPIMAVTTESLAGVLQTLTPVARDYAVAVDYRPEFANHLVLPDGQGALLGLASPTKTIVNLTETSAWLLGNLARNLPAGDWVLPQTDNAEEAEQLVMGWILGFYRFAKYKKPIAQKARLVWPQSLSAARRDSIQKRALEIYNARDRINSPANDLGPAELAAAMQKLAAENNASFTEIVGDDLLRANFPLVHAVGRASAKPPRLLELNWGDDAHPRVTLVGKGVTFDSGGLDIKSSSGMIMMRKDMGGAAAMIALAAMVMVDRLPLRLRLIVPAVENMIDGSAMRPSDIVTSRSGKTVEIGNTDAEGRLILADALSYATEDGGRLPQLLIDAATLTGAARVALGPELPGLFARDRQLAARVQAACEAASDPVWPMPLWAGYRRQLNSKNAELSSVGDSSYNGAITAALFLAEFVPPTVPWLHLDMMAWNQTNRPGRPEGGEAQAVLGLHRFLQGFGG